MDSLPHDVFFDQSRSIWRSYGDRAPAIRDRLEHGTDSTGDALILPTRREDMTTRATPLEVAPP
ncbi:hypothetical protein EL22_12420 [Halostagnicola sp. A56]|uniref:hypothetical protein n=1 Tax=Halostagnicola sp. A56 TaxID=1495067 RepID=UPI00049F356F|nr:hypothetical protein [Halostagnicola sp. A56]KDE57408.1 hypothetical protein EL22_12420 [Halostagnicola sp. A56]